MTDGARMNREPIVATMIGDPCGIGPEIVVRALAEGGGGARHLLVGDAKVVADAVALTRAPFEVRKLRAVGQAAFDPGCLDVLDPGTLEAADVTVGRVSAACGRAVTQWWRHRDRTGAQAARAGGRQGPREQ